MATVANDRQILASAGSWRASPGEYASLRSLRLKPDGSGELIYGYGQTIYAYIKCRWEVVSPGRLRLTYLDSPPYQFFKGYIPPEEKRVRDLDFALVAGEVAGVESVVNRGFKFGWSLEFFEPPWPMDLQFPYEVPRLFFGHTVQDNALDSESPSVSSDQANNPDSIHES